MNIHRILFLCTGNYYRSRMAEEYFNARAREMRIDWRADSRALVSDLDSLPNVGPLSINARRMLEKAGVAIRNGQRSPLSVCESDLSDADIVVAMSKSEHEQMLAELHPEYRGMARFWDVEDVDFVSPDIAFAKMVRHVEALLSELAT